MSEDRKVWRMGFDAGRKAQGMLVQISVPAGVDASAWVSGFLAGRRAAYDDAIIENLRELGL